VTLSTLLWHLFPTGRALVDGAFDKAKSLSVACDNRDGMLAFVLRRIYDRTVIQEYRFLQHCKLLYAHAILTYLFYANVA
jgi:hypothetical protein